MSADSSVEPDKDLFLNFKKVRYHRAGVAVQINQQRRLF